MTSSQFSALTSHFSLHLQGKTARLLPPATSSQGRTPKNRKPTTTSNRTKNEQASVSQLNTPTVTVSELIAVYSKRTLPKGKGAKYHCLHTAFLFPPCLILIPTTGCALSLNPEICLTLFALVRGVLAWGNFNPGDLYSILSSNSSISR